MLLILSQGYKIFIMVQTSYKAINNFKIRIQ